MLFWTHYTSRRGTDKHTRKQSDDLTKSDTQSYTHRPHELLQAVVAEPVPARPRHHGVAHGQTAQRAQAAPPQPRGEGQAVARHPEAKVMQGQGRMLKVRAR